MLHHLQDPRSGRPRHAMPSNRPKLLRHFMAIMDNAGTTYGAISKAAGYHKQAISEVKRKANPSILLLDDHLRACGYKLIIVPLDSTDK